MTQFTSMLSSVGALTIDTRGGEESRIVGHVACVAAPIAMGLLAISLGQDANWDLRNYHWYNAHALLNGRLSLDLAPAHTPTYFNPLLDLPLYLVAQVAPAKVVSFLLGVVQGLNFVPLYLIAGVLLPGIATAWRGGVCATLAALGLLGGGHLGLVGTTFFDNVVSLPILSGLWLVLRWIQDRRSIAALALGGAITGIGVGLKLPVATLGLGLCAAVLLCDGTVRQRVGRTLTVGLSALVGLILSGGWWMVYLARATGNPLFPLFNHVFESPMATSESYRDTQFVPSSLVDGLLFPFRIVIDPHVTGEIQFVDLRIATLAIVALITVGFTLVRRVRAELSPALRAMATFLTVSYVAWLAVFGIYRYAIVIEMLAPIVAVACIALWPLTGHLRAAIGVALSILIAVTTRPGDWGRVAWSEKFVEVAAPSIRDADEAMVLMTGFTPMAWVISALPAHVPAVRVHGFSYGPDEGDIGFAGVALRRVEAHRGSFYLLVDESELAASPSVLSHYRLVPDTDHCQPIFSNLDDGARLCPVSRAKGPS